MDSIKKKTFEELAEEFCQMYGYYPPGKDNPVGVTYDEDVRYEQWMDFINV